MRRSKTGKTRQAASELIRFDLTVPMRSEAELVAARAVEQVAENMAFDDRSRDQIRLALIEACLNAFEHSGSQDPNVYINFVVEKDRLLIIVRDFGKGFDPLAVPEPAIRNKLCSMGNRRGWGLLLIRKMMDEVVYEDASPGTSLRMVKYLPESPPQEARSVQPRALNV